MPGAARDGAQRVAELPGAFGPCKALGVAAAVGRVATYGGEAGDALITVHIAPHPHFKVEGRDLRLDLPVAVYEAVLGGKVQIPTLGGAVS